MSAEYGDSNVRMAIHDWAFVPVGNVTNPMDMKLNIRHNLESTLSFTMSNDKTNLIPFLTNPGGRVVVRNDYGQLFSGYVDTISGVGPDFAGPISVTATSDFIYFKDVLGWVVPDKDVTQQGSAGEYDKKSGPAETVIKYYAQRNMVDRLHLPIEIEPDQGRGATVDASLRFHPLYDRLFPIVDGAGIDQAGINVDIVQQGADKAKRLLLKVTTPAATPVVVSETSGRVASYTWGRKQFTASRVLVLGAGEGVLRVTRNYSDTTREAYGRIRERVRDARDLAAEDAALLAKRGQEVLDEGRATASLSLSLSESGYLTYGQNYRVGDMVKGTVGGVTVGPTVLSEVEINWNREDGYRTTPKIGDREDDPDVALVSAVSTLARRIRTDQVGR